MTVSIAALMPEDLEHILTHTGTIWDELRGKKIFITGGTGFFGKWLLESFIYANKALKLDASLTCLTRDSKSFLIKYPFFSQHESIHFWDGDIRDFECKDECFDILIHAATEASVSLNKNAPLMMWDTIVLGTKRVLDFAVQANVKQCLILSSGAIYGPSFEGTDLHESYANYPLSEKTASAYAYGKISSEHLSMLYYKTHGLDLKIARCFAFLGPYLPLDSHFAVGNFILNAINNEPIVIKGNGQTIRSYLYAADLMIWLWTILIKGQAGKAYNVGSNNEIHIGGLAEKIRNIVGNQLKINVLDQKCSGWVEKYVPNIGLSQNELDLHVLINLERALQKTISWHMELLSNKVPKNKEVIYVEEKSCNFR